MWEDRTKCTLSQHFSFRDKSKISEKYFFSKIAKYQHNTVSFQNLQSKLYNTCYKYVFLNDLCQKI